MPLKDEHRARYEDIEEELRVLVSALIANKVLSRERLIKIVTENNGRSGTETISAVYFRGSDRLIINQAFQLSGAPAKILRKLIRGYILDKRCEFSHKEFIGDSSITTNPYNPNFSIRCSRLKATLEKWELPMRLESPARGIVRLDLSSKLEYAEED